MDAITAIFYHLDLEGNWCWLDVEGQVAFGQKPSRRASSFQLT